MKFYFFYYLLVICVIIACGSADNPELAIKATATLRAVVQNNVGEFDVLQKDIGHAIFTQNKNIVTVNITLFGLPPNSTKSVHIHEGTLKLPAEHWNMKSLNLACDLSSLGKPWDKPYIGDIGNVPIGAAGTGELIVQTDLWSLNKTDTKNILGKVVYVHQQGEDFSMVCAMSGSHSHATNLKIGGGEIVLEK